MKAKLIINPKAGRRKPSPLPEIRRVFEAQNLYKLDVHETTGPGDATRVAKQAALDNYDLVIAAGGDGSILEVANGLIHSNTCLGVIPVGTENVLAREMGIPLKPGPACEFMLKAECRTIDTGCIAGQHFVCFAGIGFDAHVVHSLPPERKTRFGALAYILTATQKLHGYRKVPRRAKLTLDGVTQEVEFLILVVSNIRKYGGGMIPAPEAEVDDGLLDICVFPNANYISMMRQMAAIKQGKHTKLKGVGYFQAKTIEIETDISEQIQLDGDAWPSRSPFKIEVVPKSLQVRF